MARRLPPLNQIRAFEAAARHQSFLKAGEELHVTHSAISHQVKALEETLGRQLFHRNARGVELTADAKPLFEDAARALDLLAKGVENFVELEAQQDLKVSVAPSFASRWLLPRLSDFHGQHDHITINTDMSVDVLDFHSSGIDLAIRHGYGQWDGLVVKKLFDEELYAVASPRLVEEQLSVSDWMKLETVQLLTASVRANEWELWFERYGQKAPTSRRLITYPTQALAIDGAIAGLGIALADKRLLESEVHERRLVKVSDDTLETGRGVYLVYPKGVDPDDRIAAFEKWILAEARQTRSS